MKFRFMPLVLGLLFLLIKPYVYADITTGDSSAESTVETNIQGGGKVYTKIETEVNGIKKVVESSEPGKIEVKATNDSYSVTKTQESISIINSPASASPTITNFPKKEIKPKSHAAINLFGSFFEKLFKFIFSL